MKIQNPIYKKNSLKYSKNELISVKIFEFVKLGGLN
jgi:hypothetical protein